MSLYVCALLSLVTIMHISQIRRMKSEYIILICDDNEFLSRMYAYKFELEGYKVYVVDSGETVVAQMKKIKPHIVILDLMMPIKTGFEVLQEIIDEADTSIKAIPVIVVSDLAQECDIVTVKKLGAVDFIIKSDITPSDLLVVVEKYLQKLCLKTWKNDMTMTPTPR